MEYGQKQSKQALPILIYATLSSHNGKPALILRRVIKDPELIKLFTLTLLQQGRIQMPAIITISKPLVFTANAKRLRIIK